MSDAIYPAAKTAFLTGQLDWLSDPIVCVLVGTAGYTYSANHVSLADVPIASRIAVSGTLTHPTVALGVVDADDTSFGTVSGDTVSAVILCKNTGTDIASPLIAYMDQALTGLPLTPNGTPITITWSSGLSKIFAL